MLQKVPELSVNSTVILGGGSASCMVVAYYHPSIPIFANKVYEGFHYPGVVLCNLGQALRMHWNMICMF